MLLLSNGAVKSGSTWLFNILKSLTGFSAPPNEYLDQHSVNPAIDQKQFKRLFNELDFANNDYLTKEHLGEQWQRDLILSHPNAFVLDIKRDLKDVVVSFYYHIRRLEGYKYSFPVFYWERGRQTADAVHSYNKLWANNHERVYCASYERLHTDFKGELQDIAKFLKLEITEADITRIASETQFETLKQKYSDPKNSSGMSSSERWQQMFNSASQDPEVQFFRKGVQGDWRNHFTSDMIRDIEHIEKNGLQLPIIDNAISKLARLYGRFSSNRR